MHVDVAIIGAGMSGLAAGIRLAIAGKRVAVLERHTVWGGLNSFYKKDGHHFDTGLHALTNFVLPGRREAVRPPLLRVARQLRFRIEDLELDQQGHSKIAFFDPDAELRFENGLERLSDEIAARFPSQIDGFVRLAKAAEPYPEATVSGPLRSARRWLSEFLSDPLLVEMLLCPLLFYGSAAERDLDVDQFVILFNSIFREGLSRPRRGVRQILDVLVKRLEEEGGQLLRRAGVRQIRVDGGRVKELILDDERVVTADLVISSAGLVETTRLRSDVSDPAALEEHAGNLAFVENIFLVSKPPAELGCDACCIFFNRGPTFEWAEPDDWVDTRSGVVSCPDNFRHERPLDEHMVRITNLASWRRWFSLERGEDRYRERKAAAARAGKEALRPFFDTDLDPYIVYTDSYTPRTVTHYTGHVRGAVYGSPDKRRSGRTDLENLFLCGTDQGLLGVVGAMHSGVTIANVVAMGLDRA